MFAPYPFIMTQFCKRKWISDFLSKIMYVFDKWGCRTRTNISERIFLQFTITKHWFSTYRMYEMANIIKVKLKTKKSWVRLLRNFILIGDKVWTNDRFNPSSSYWHSGTQFCVMRVVFVIGISGLYTPKKNRIQQHGNQIRFLAWRVKTRTEPLTQTSSGHISLSLIKVSAGEIKRVF